jgi:hypothetical protein
MRSALLGTAIGLCAAGSAAAAEAQVTLGQPTRILVPPPEFIPAPVVPPNGAPAPKITPLPPLVIQVAPVVVIPVPPSVQGARK